ncbi:anthranilate phosphoribosyltransferase [Tulasnella sp. UAMH 9824]|nr:anthranilate phosphoribosyltransferase [Tulasnella sp. UAMH 9824]
MSPLQYSPATFKPILEHLITNPKTFTQEEARLAFHHLGQDDFSGATPVQVGAFLMALKYSNKAHSPEIIASAADVMRSYAAKTEVQRDNSGQEPFVVDIVGTGGDEWNTFNVSTAAAIVAAGAGAKVCKHGSSATVSTSGSSDLLSALGCPLLTPTPSVIPSSLPFTFLHAAATQPSISRLEPVRKSLPFRTIFNVLGPLLNPTNPRGMVLGVYTKELGPVFAHALKESGKVERALIVCGQEGLDEISIAGSTWVWELNGVDGSVTESTIHPALFGIEARPLETVVGSTPDVNAKVLMHLLSSGKEPLPSNDELPPSFSMGAVQDYVLINAAALLKVTGLATDWKDGVRLARESIDSGKALSALTMFRTWGQNQTA